MNHFHDVHTIAERYLRDIESGRVTFYAEPTEAPVILTAEAVVSKVMVMREARSAYLVGIKRDGTPVWSGDVKHARSFDSDSLTLVNSIATCRNNGIHVETMPACWFHT